MKELFYAIADFFGLIFNFIEELGNIPNYFYIAIIFEIASLWLSEFEAGKYSSVR